MGKIFDCEHYKKKYAVDHVHYVHDLEKVLKQMNSDKLLVLVNKYFSCTLSQIQFIIIYIERTELW